jgi:hypothetical protein
MFGSLTTFVGGRVNQLIIVHGEAGVLIWLRLMMWVALHLLIAVAIARNVGDGTLGFRVSASTVWSLQLDILVMVRNIL